MNRRLVTIFLVALVIAAGYTFIAYRLLGRRMVIAHAAKTTRIVAAANDVPLGTVLNASNLTYISMPDPLPKGVVLDAATLVGRGVTSQLYRGEPVLESRLASSGSGGGLAATIPLGMRACAVKVDEVVGVAGFVTPGMRVDVLVSGNPPSSQTNSEGTMAKTILQNIQVISAGTDIQKDAAGKPQQVQVVNLLVNPEQAERLSLATNQVKIQLVLRNPLDTTVEETPGIAMANLFGAPAKVEPPAAAIVTKSLRAKPRVETHPETFAVQVLNGSKTTNQSVDSSWGK